MKNEIKDKSTFILKRNFLSLILFTVLMNFNVENILSATRGTEITVKFVEEKYSSFTDNDCVLKCKNTSSNIVKSRCVRWGGNALSGCEAGNAKAKLRDGDGQYTIIYNIDLLMDGDNVWAYLAYRGQCSYAKDKTIDLWGDGERADINGWNMKTRVGIDWHSAKHTKEAIEKDAKERIRGMCTEQYKQGPIKSAIESCVAGCTTRTKVSDARTSLFVGDKEITTVGEFLDEIPVTELIKVYDPNMVNY